MRALQHEEDYRSQLQQNDGRGKSSQHHNKSTIAIDEQDQFSPDNWLPSSDHLIRLTGKHLLVDEWLAECMAHMRTQQTRKEMLDMLDSLLQNYLLRWQTRNRTLSRNVITHREGSSEYQYQSVLGNLLPAPGKAMKVFGRLSRVATAI